MKGYKIFGNVLRDLKLSPVLGNPGTTELPMLRDISNYVLTLHDGIAVGMADGIALWTRKPVLVNLHTDLGLGNAMAFLMTAARNHSPLIVTAGQQDQRHLAYEPLLSGNLTEMADNFAKYRTEVRKPDDIAYEIRKAYQIAEEPPRGPVFLSFPMDVMEAEGSYVYEDVARSTHNVMDEDDVIAVANAINDAKNPAVIFGSEIDEFDAFSEAMAFAEKLGCPVYSEPLGNRSSYPSDDPHYAGELYPAAALVDLDLMQYDLLLFIGSDLTLYPYTTDLILPGKRKIVIGLNNRRMIGETYRANPKIFLARILDLVHRKCNFRRSRDYMKLTDAVRDKKKMGQKYVSYRISKYFSDFTMMDEAISVSETLRHYFGYRPNGYFTARSGQIGWALPASLGIAMYNPKVVTVVGDGSLMYSIQALWTAKHYGIPLKLIVLENGGYNILRSYAMSYFPEISDAEYLRPEMDIESIVSSYDIDVRIADAELKELEWLRSGSDQKALIVKMDRSIPSMF
ncbi:benzoylformate decarboxylase [Thermoplasma sp. Kam2015]|uniref:thiamine pyrophosphate-binding protein n=1 Tax=Thermoplasma sp. Kam2015 TaxID=2094122 RepID=UPI000D8F1A2C|nr:thiamine pyrophosphate-binding protein [Thermoplasma sp. Kam2015]PYB68514.1 benzoylformate decarboxylase [Thermoplasma sp. Kam2015]